MAQLGDHCTGIAEVVGSNPAQSLNFFQVSVLVEPLSCSSVGRALHRHRRGRDFESRSEPEFFSGLCSSSVAAALALMTVITVYLLFKVQVDFLLHMRALYFQVNDCFAT